MSTQHNITELNWTSVNMNGPATNQQLQIVVTYVCNPTANAIVVGHVTSTPTGKMVNNGNLLSS